MKKILVFFLLGMIFFNFSRTIFINRQALFEVYNPEYWQERYEESQWAKGFEAKSQMSDEELYAYAGWRQIKGEDPTKIEPTAPPLGKYFIGLSIYLFKNPVVISPILGLLFILVLYFLSQKILDNQLLSLSAVALFTFEPIFKENLTSSMLDLPLALFIALTFYFLIKGRNSPKWYLPLVICLALVSVTKMYFLGFGLTLAIAGYLLFFSAVKKKKDFFYLLAYSPAFVFVYFMTYFKFFFSGHNLWDFKYYHFWVFKFARVQVTEYPPGEILRILFSGEWRTWWGQNGIIKVDQWSFLWALSFVFLIPTFYLSFKKRDWNLLAMILWPISILGMYFVGVPYPRYLLPVLPPLYICLVYNLKYWGQRIPFGQFSALANKTK